MDSQDSTRTLIGRARQGDGGAWDRVFGRVILRLRGWAHGRLPRASRGAHETHDLVQDAALGVWKRVDHLDFQKPGDLEAYVRQAVLNRIRDEARRRRVRPINVSVDTQIPGTLPTPLDDALSREQTARYQAAFAALDVSEREAVIARLDMGLSYDQVADLLGKTSAAAARMTVNRALKRLRDAVEATEP
jgi:RNA polymerase sigma-70 factor (ECF subfamily)